MAGSDPDSKTEVESIRNILFGEQINQTEERFRQIENSINSLRLENSKLREALEAELTQREKNENELSTHISELKAQIIKERKENFGDQSELLTAFKKAIDLYMSKVSK